MFATANKPSQQSHKRASFRIKATVEHLEQLFKPFSDTGGNPIPLTSSSCFVPFLFHFLAPVNVSKCMILLWARTHECCTTDFNYGANTELTDNILSLICTVCNEGCSMAGKKHLFCTACIMFYTFVWNFFYIIFALQKEVKSPTMWLIYHLSVCEWFTSAKDSKWWICFYG